VAQQSRDQPSSPLDRDSGWDPLQYNADEPWVTQQSGRFFAGLRHRTDHSPVRLKVLRASLAVMLLLWVALILSYMVKIL